MDSVKSLAFVLLGLVMLPVSLAARSKPVAAAPDADYVAALATANRFLHAWESQDHEAGVLMLTDAAKGHTSADHLDAFFSSEEAEKGFEIARGKKLRAGRYVFPVALWRTVAGKARPRYSAIVVVRTGKDEWAIDKLP